MSTTAGRDVARLIDCMGYDVVVERNEVIKYVFSLPKWVKEFEGQRGSSLDELRQQLL